MSVTKIGAKAHWGGSYVEEIAGAVTLTASDSGKIFLCAAATVTLPAAADSAGWNAIFIYKSGSSTVNSLTIDASGDMAIIVGDGSAFQSGKSIA
tara:strand:+ start:524 stop:808 length:285 start_codon:yes stop_codon:yes gene_type:complete